MDHGRDPCPYVILNDFGGAFCMGVSLWKPNRSFGLAPPGLLPPASSQQLEYRELDQQTCLTDNNK